MLPDTMAQFGVMPQAPGGLEGLINRLRGASIGKGNEIAQFGGKMLKSAGGPVGNVAGGALSGGATGAKIGSMIAPGVGTAIGGAIGAVGGAIGGGMNWREQQHQKQMEALMSIRNRMQ